MIQGNGLRSAYSATLQRIQAQKGSRSRIGMEVLMWLSHSERPLNASELCHAMGVEIGSTDLNSQNIPTIETLLGCSLGLVTVEAYTYTVRLVHYTLQEYLSNNSDLFHRPHSMIAEVCLTYLNFQCIRDLPPIPDWSEPLKPLLIYASRHWGTHARREMTESVNTLALKLLEEFDKHIASGMLLSYNEDNWDEELRQYNPKGFTGLHWAAYFGIMETAVALLEMKRWNLDVTDITGNTALLWAARKGYGDVVKVILEREDVSVNIADNGGRTPLSWAADDGHEGVVKMLLEREDVSPDTADKDGQTPLSQAARYGHVGVMKMLLEREDVSPNTADIDGRTPLLWAAQFGHVGVVNMLLEWKGVSPNTADNDVRTPLLWRAGNGHGDIAKMLLARRDITPNTVDKDGRTPLFWATRNEHGGVVKTLLELEDPTPTTAYNGGRAPLSSAAKGTDPSIVEMLPEQYRINRDIMMNNLTGQTALIWTLEKHGGALKPQPEDQELLPQAAGGNNLTDLFLPEPSESSQRPSKRIRRS